MSLITAALSGMNGLMSTQLYRKVKERTKEETKRKKPLRSRNPRKCRRGRSGRNKCPRHSLRETAAKKGRLNFHVYTVRDGPGEIGMCGEEGRREGWLQRERFRVPRPLPAVRQSRRTCTEVIDLHTLIVSGTSPPTLLMHTYIYISRLATVTPREHHRTLLSLFSRFSSLSSSLAAGPVTLTE